MSLLALHFIVSVPFPVSACGNGQSEASIICPLYQKNVISLVMNKTMINSSKNRYGTFWPDNFFWFFIVIIFSIYLVQKTSDYRPTDYRRFRLSATIFDRPKTILELYFCT